MFSARYLIAVIIGLSLGAAIGWVSGRETQPSTPAAAGQHQSQHRSHHARSAPVRPRPAQTPGLTFRQVQLRAAQCLAGSSSLQQQVVCLRRLLRSQLGAGVPGLPTDLSPFTFPGDGSGYG